eukprot:2371059-Lingulodinium_polyedra.AAC.1
MKTQERTRAHCSGSVPSSCAGSGSFVGSGRRAVEFARPAPPPYANDGRGGPNGQRAGAAW